MAGIKQQIVEKLHMGGNKEDQDKQQQQQQHKGGNQVHHVAGGEQQHPCEGGHKEGGGGGIMGTVMDKIHGRGRGCHCGNENKGPGEKK